MLKHVTIYAVCLGCCLLLCGAFPAAAQTYSPYAITPSLSFPSYGQPPYPQYGQTYPQYPQYIQPSQPQPYMPSPQHIQPVQPQPSPYYPPAQCGPGSWFGSPQQMYRCGLSLVYAKRYYDAMQVLHHFLQAYPHSSLADNALYWIGECYYAQKQYYRALSYFQRIQFEYPRGNKVPDSLLKIGLCYISLKRYTEGCQVLNELVHRYPNSDPAGKAYRWLRRCGGGGYYSSPSPSYAPSYGDTSLPKNW